MPLTRLAPSPTGALHLGNARTFLVNWLMARRMGWRILLRIEDIDGPRIKPGASQQLIDDLQWLGLDWDEGPIVQTTRLPLYQAAIQRLIDAKLAYPCTCSRKEVELAASAPHAEDGATVYPNTCRDRFASVEEARKIGGKEPAIRFRVPPRHSECTHEESQACGGLPHSEIPREYARDDGEASARASWNLDGTLEFTDEFAGPQHFDLARRLGDFVIAKSDGTPAYQLAVVVDDADAGVDAIVRGDDLLDSTPRQILLYRALNLESKIPKYWHLPLVIGEDGRRLAKRHGDTRLSFYRNLGVPPARILRLLARWCGMPPTGDIRTAAGLLPHFDLTKIPHDPITFTPRDDADLRSE